MISTAIKVADPQSRALSLHSEGRSPDFVVDPLIDRFDFFYLLRKHWWKLSLVPIFGCLLALAVYLTREPLYKSSAVVLIDRSFEEIIQFEDVDSGGGDDMPGLRSLEIAIVADSVILRVVDLLDLRSEAGFLPKHLAEKPDLTDSELVTYLRDHRIGAYLLDGTRLIRISVLDPDPERAQRIVGAFTTEFESFISEQRRDEVQQARASLEKQALAARLAALASEEHLKVFRENNPEYPVEQDNDLFNARLTQLGVDRNAVTEERRKLGNQREVLANIDPETSPLEVIEVAQYGELNHVSQLLTAIAASQTKFGVVSERYLEKHPTFITAEREVERNEAQLRRLAKDIISAVDAKYLSATRQEEDLSKDLAGAVAGLGTMKASSSEFRALHQQTERDWEIHEAFQAKLRESAVSSEISSQFATVVSKPLLPHKKAEPELPLYLAIGGGLGTLLGAGWLVIVVFAGLPFSHPRQLEQRLGLPIIADWSEPESGEESPQATRLLHYLGTSADQTIQITAPKLNGVGKSVAFEVARLAALHGRKTLLIIIKAGPGECRIEPAEDPNLLLLEITPETVRDLDRFPAGLEKLKPCFDNIFFDASDSRDPEMVDFLSSHTDLDVVVVEKYTTKKQFIEERVTRLSRGGQSPVALIMVSPDSRWCD